MKKCVIEVDVDSLRENNAKFMKTNKVIVKSQQKSHLSKRPPTRY